MRDLPEIGGRTTSAKCAKLNVRFDITGSGRPEEVDGLNDGRGDGAQEEEDESNY